MTYSIIGTDTSHYEGTIDISKNMAAGARFILPKLGQGNFTDPNFAETWKNAKGKLARGAYWFLDIRYSIRQQAEMFAAALKDDPGEIAPVVDFEQQRVFFLKACPATGRKGWNCLSATELFGFIDYFKKAWKGYGLQWAWTTDMIIYTGYSYWREHGSTSGAWAQYPLWISEPDPVDEPAPLMPWSTWTFWQTSFAADGPKYGTDPLVAKGIDLNCFNGDESAWAKFIGAGIPIPPPVEPPAPVTEDVPVSLTVTMKSGKTYNAAVAG